MPTVFLLQSNMTFLFFNLLWWKVEVDSSYASTDGHCDAEPFCTFRFKGQPLADHVMTKSSNDVFKCLFN